MAKTKLLNKTALLKQLQPVKYVPAEQKEKTAFEKMNLAGALLALAEIDHEHEYELCLSIAKHLLDKIPEPDDDMNFEED